MKHGRNQAASAGVSGRPTITIATACAGKASCWKAEETLMAAARGKRIIETGT